MLVSKAVKTFPGNKAGNKSCKFHQSYRLSYYLFKLLLDKVEVVDLILYADTFLPSQNPAVLHGPVARDRFFLD